MKNIITHQEILLMTGTGFASRQYTEKDNSNNSGVADAKEKLKDACWDGLLKEMLPEIFTVAESESKLYLWQVREANEFFALEMAEYPIVINNYLSVDPYRFMEVQEFN